jgi:Uma2 family endonuclease
MVTTQLVTAQDLWLMGEAGEHAELIDGEIVQMAPPGGEQAIAQLRLGSLLLGYVDERGLGQAFGEVGFILAKNPDTVLAPDLAFVEASRLPTVLTGFLALAPDLAIEIVSPSNSAGEIERKIAIYLEAGTRLIWVVYPRQRQVVVHTPGEAPRVFAESDELPGGDVLPGLTIPVANIFG